MTPLPDPEAYFTRQPSGAELRGHSILAQDKRAGVALALGGGFSRGFAHLGVLEVLDQEGIRISAIVGTSIGGLLGAAYADGISVQELCELGRKVRIRDFIRCYTSCQTRQHRSVLNPSVEAFSADVEAVPSHDRIGRFVRDRFHTRRVEELSIPTAIVATDLDTCAPYVFTRGPLEVALRASCAFPGLFRPVEHEGRLLADGCIVAPVPTAVAARMDGGFVLGVAVGSNTANASSHENAVKVFDQTFLGARRSTANPSWVRHADVMLEPDVHHIDWNDFTRVDEACAAGAEAMRRALPHVREALARRTQLSLEEASGQAQSGWAL